MYKVKVVDEIKVQILCPVTFSENRGIYEITSRNVEEPKRQHLVIWRKVTCWINKATRAQAHARSRAHAPTHTHPPTHTHTQTHAHPHTHRQIYNTYCFSAAALFS